MDTAAFSIIDYRFDQVHIDLAKDIKNDLSLDFKTNGTYFSEKNEFQLIFHVEIKDTEEDNPFIQIRCRGYFRFKNVSKLEEIPDFFYSNSIAILFPYVRAYISMVTTQANIKGIILPTLNLSDLGPELRANTIQK